MVQVWLLLAHSGVILLLRLRLQVSSFYQCIADCADIAQASTRSEANTMAAAPPAKANADKARLAKLSQAPAHAGQPPDSAQAPSSIVAAELAKAIEDTLLLLNSTSTSGPLPAAPLAQTIVDRARFPNLAHSQHKHPPLGAQATSCILGGNAAAQAAKATSPAASTAPQTQAAKPATAHPAAKPAATATWVSPSSITFTAPFSLSASLQHHFSMPQQAAAAQLPAEPKQTAPAQHSLLHRGTTSDYRQAQAAQHTLPSSLLADPTSAALRGRAASNAALQAKIGVSTTQGVFTLPSQPQEWSASIDLQQNSTPQLAYAAFMQYMKNKIGGDPMLDTAVASVFPPDALQHQLDQQFMEHARNRCQVIPKVAQPHTTLPYSQSSEAPNTWRSAVLRLIECLVEVHYQGVVAKDLDASQQHAMLFRTLSMQLEKLQVRLAADPSTLPLNRAFYSLCCTCSISLLHLPHASSPVL